MTNSKVSKTEDGLVSLNLVYEYPVSWSKFQVLRDFVQNFYDAVRWQGWSSRFSYELSEDVLTLRSQDVGFSYDWLLHIGASTKREKHGEYAGYFGEGFKIAALCAIRDYHWEVELSSRDWNLQVVTDNVLVDGRQLKTLAYRVLESQPFSTDTVLKISPFTDTNLLKSVLWSFYYPENPLFGEKIWESSEGAIYYRSKELKPWGYPSTSDLSGTGILFAGYQAMGSFEYPLVICLHTYRHNDRERKYFFRMDVVKVIELLASKLSPEASIVVLKILKNRWNDVPRKKYDFESWYSIVRKLVRNIASSEVCKEAWRQEFPDLLVAHHVKPNDLAKYNRRKQARAWMRDSEKKYRIVQEAFGYLDYPTLEECCANDDGFSITREPTEEEIKRIECLETLAKVLLKELFTKVKLPPCKVIKGERAVWQGLAVCTPIKGEPPLFQGLPIRFHLPYVAVKKTLLFSPILGTALSTYLHELAHMFGGDGSHAFSRVLSLMMDITLSNTTLISAFQERWEELNVTAREN